MEDNKELVDRFPFLKYTVPPGEEEEPVHGSWLNHFPHGWFKAFGVQMCEEISAALPPQDGLDVYDRYHLLQIKEKYGMLRWEDAGVGVSKVRDIVDKYERLSEHTCINCGKPATRMSTHRYGYCGRED